jgi:hypothetical protein
MRLGLTRFACLFITSRLSHHYQCCYGLSTLHCWCVQVDWEAILAKHPQQFIDRLSRWFVPEAALPIPPLPATSTAAGSSTCNPAAATSGSSAGASPAASPRGSSSKVVAAAKALPDVEKMPAVSEVLATLRQRLNALNGPDAKPV